MTNLTATHRLLSLQLRTLGLEAGSLPATFAQWRQFLDQVNLAYEQVDRQRSLMEQSQQMSLRKMQVLYERLEEAQRIARLGNWSFTLSSGRMRCSEECFQALALPPGHTPSYRVLLKHVQRKDRFPLRTAIRNALLLGLDFDISIRLYLTGGETRWIRIAGQPARNVNGLVTRLHGTVEDITQRKAVELRQSMEYAVTRLLADSRSIEETMPQVLETICQTAGWACGALWTLNRQKDAFERTAVWSQKHSRLDSFFQHSKHAIKLPACAGLIGRTLLLSEPVWIDDVTLDPHFPRANAARETGLHAAFAFPVQAGGEILGVMEFFRRRVQKPDSELLESAHIMGRQIGQFFERKQAENALRESEAHFRSLVEQASDSFYVHDLAGNILDVNQHGCDSLGYSREELLARRVTDIDVDLSLDELQYLHEQVKSRKPVALESRHMRKDGTTFPVEIRMGPINIDGQQHTLSLVRDISQRKEMEEHIQHLAYHDALTGLPNRAMFNHHLHHAATQAQRHNKRMAVLFIDLDRFKSVNDSLGHDAGDRLLQEMSGRISACMQAEDVIALGADRHFVARLGGDEFVVLIEEVPDSGRIGQIAQKILSAMVREHALDGQPVQITASIGISLFPEDGRNGFTLMKHADMAMYRAKQSGKNMFQFYSPQIDSHSTQLLAMEIALRRAIEAGELALHYQPKVDAGTGAITGMEALVRWKHPDLGLVSPAHFIPLAEETGLIVPLSKWVLTEACRQNKSWQRQGLPALRIAVNLSPRQFSDENLAAETARVLKDAGMDPALLELEITESMMMYDTERTVRILSEIRNMGIRIAIDDFGIGYSSLSHLKQFQVDIIKIDRSFIRDIPHDQADAAIAHAIIAMGKSLKATVVAEGVETVAQLNFLRERGCDEIQGYYFGRPLPADDFARLLKQNSEAALPQTV
ncbi:MAG TPA: EAL domain-containing protein [Noviherbaspirillum sp.]|uniref:EAL domain-containing protein n=1 Tax=Noviherbaspirillum sp. TaxID=1926288 RepID=UPI002DDCE71A|nr:EAL domain-containing protein [Noviherbaspirillum sp.]HEV2608825.1 EAL domain-containing protein [Noviherbaspirillum sp.]